MKKRIFIAIHYMEIGGAERALLGLLEALNTSVYDVDLFVFSHQGEFMEFIPHNIHLLEENPTYASLEKSSLRVFFEGKWSLLISRVWARFYNAIINRAIPYPSACGWDEFGRYTVRMLPSLFYLGEYDMAISFLNPHYIVRDKVKARTKVAWIHTDYSTVHINPERELAVWESYDHIISVSPSVTKAFLDQFPSLKTKICLMENMLPTELIRRQADEFDALPEMPGEMRLLSIGRFCFPKNFLGAVEIMAELCKLRNDVTWYIIGYGTQENKIREKIYEWHLEEKFVILGKKDNPYPYIKACDLYVQPSIYEGKAVTVKEAQFLGKTVAITRYPTSTSQLEDGVDGLIIPLGNPTETAYALSSLLSSPDQMKMLSDNCRNRNYSGKENITILEKLIY